MTFKHFLFDLTIALMVVWAKIASIFFSIKLSLVPADVFENVQITKFLKRNWFLSHKTYKNSFLNKIYTPNWCYGTNWGIDKQTRKFAVMLKKHWVTKNDRFREGFWQLYSKYHQFVISVKNTKSWTNNSTILFTVLSVFANSKLLPQKSQMGILQSVKQTSFEN